MPELVRPGAVSTRYLPTKQKQSPWLQHTARPLSSAKDSAQPDTEVPVPAHSAASVTCLLLCALTAASVASARRSPAAIALPRQSDDSQGEKN